MHLFMNINEFVKIIVVLKIQEMIIYQVGIYIT